MKAKNLIINLFLLVFLTIILCEIDHELILKPYYLIYDKIHRKSDSQGVRLSVYSPLRIYYNPKFIADDAYFLYNEYKKSNDAQFRQKFLLNIDWLLKNKTEKNNASVWYTTFPWPTYNMTPPWASSIAQGEIAVVMYYAFELTGDSSFYRESEATLNSFLVEVDDGGIRIFENDSTWWYEEYADPDAENPRILNGMMFALLSIYELQQKMRNKLVQRVFDNGVRALKKHLPEYDLGWWTYLDCQGYLASESYHQKHVMLVKKFYDITGDDFLKMYYERWQKYKTTFWKKALLNLKIGRINFSQKVVIMSNFCISVVVVVLINMFSRRSKCDVKK